jgi:hypothetical protein
MRIQTMLILHEQLDCSAQSVGKKAKKKVKCFALLRATLAILAFSRACCIISGYVGQIT